MNVRPEQLVSTSDLIIELLGRFDHGVVALCKKNPHGDGGITIRRWKGNHHTCAGLAQDVSGVALASLHDIEEDVNVEDL